ncbi:Sec-independent protein translocase protein TatB [Kingella potus]|uniref:Sec-independent protein translocase protein TatB n=1 Tax=Kingella potus TaxID=265175 RepID=UPI001FD1604C|nr:Sec-independent protein translocase protein TatB [Kingella potus]UOP01192.1 Sec-independent protein translocase protein TatB [Kingella potus]
MFELGFSELLLTGIVALVVLGPERLPKVARTARMWLGKVRRFASGMKDELERQIEAADLQEAKEGFESAVRGVKDSLPDIQDVRMPAWERLPPQRTPADFGIDEAAAGQGGAAYDRTAPVHLFTLRRRAMNRRRSLRPRPHARPKLRVRRAGRLKP